VGPIGGISDEWRRRCDDHRVCADSADSQASADGIVPTQWTTQLLAHDAQGLRNNQLKRLEALVPKPKFSHWRKEALLHRRIISSGRLG